MIGIPWLTKTGLAAGLTAFALLVQNNINPILLRIIRQRLRSRSFMGAFFFVLFISTCLTIFAAQIATMSPKPAGMRLFVELIFIWMLIVNFQASVTFGIITNDAQSNTWELLKITGITPARFIFGHCWANILFGQLYGAVLAPFIVMSYLLQGVNLIDIIATIFFVPVVSFTMGMLGTFFGILAAAVGGVTFFRAVLLVLILIGALVFTSMFSSGFIGTALWRAADGKIADVIVGFLVIFFLWSICVFALWTFSYDLLNGNSFPAYQRKSMISKQND